MNDYQYSAFLHMIRALDACMSYASVRVTIQLSSLEDLKRACTECIDKGFNFKISSGYRITIIRGD